MCTHWRDGDRDREVELTALGEGRWRVRVDGSEFELSAAVLADGRLRLGDDQGSSLAEVSASLDQRFVRLDGLDFILRREPQARRRGAGGRATPDHGLEAPLPGVVTRVMVGVGDEVKKGQPLLALEAMKMEHMIRAPRAGRVKSVSASPGQMVQAGATLVALEDAPG